MGCLVINGSLVLGYDITLEENLAIYPGIELMTSRIQTYGLIIHLKGGGQIYCIIIMKYFILFLSRVLFNGSQVTLYDGSRASS